jgi:hypothetical protein
VDDPPESDTEGAGTGYPLSATRLSVRRPPVYGGGRSGGLKMGGTCETNQPTPID